MLIKNSIELFIENLRIRNRSMETIVGYQKTLIDFMKFLEFYYNSPVYVGEVNLFDLELYLKYQTSRGIQAVSVNRSIYIFRSFYNYLERRGLVKKNISKLLEPITVRDKERISLNKEEIEELLENIEHEVIKVAVYTLANTGLRVSELIALKLEDVDLRNNIIYVKNGKGGKDRKIPINRALNKILRNYLREIRESSSDNFFATTKSGGLSAQYINKILRDTCKDLKWDKHLTAHILRHSFASNLIREGVSVSVVQKLLGHADLRVTSRYIHQNISDLKKAVEQL